LPSHPDEGKVGGSRNRKTNIQSLVHPAYGGVNILPLSPLYHTEEGFESSSNTLSWAQPAYGDVELLQLTHLHYPEEGFEEKSRNRNDGRTVEAGGHVLTCKLDPAERAAA
jgi:hypothetical protein